MFRYGLYVAFSRGNNPFEEVKEVEGYLIIPETVPVAIWGTVKYKNQELLEVIPIQNVSDVETLDNYLKILIKRLRNRIEFIKTLEEVEKDENIQTRTTQNR